MDFLHMEIKGYGPIKNKIQYKLPNAINVGGQAALKSIGNDIVDISNTKLYSTVSPGHSDFRPEDSIKNNWETDVWSDNSSINIVIGNTSNHAAMVEYGTGVYAELGNTNVIEPKRSPYLRFNMDGEEFRARYVKGQHPKAYFRNSTINANNSKIVSTLKATIQSMLQGAFL